MFDPRPEIRTATRARSCIVSGGPGLRRTPASFRSGHGAAALARLDTADPANVLACSFETACDTVRIIRADDHRHSDTAIERARHFFGCDPSALLQKGED